MKKVTKKKQIEDLQTVVAAQWRQINKLKLHLGRLVDIDWTDEQADHDAVIAILDSEKPKLKVLDQSVFDHPYATDRFKYVALNADGQTVFFESKPVISNCLDIWVVHTGSVMPMLNGYDATNWQNSLIERDKIELTGSDLCRAMLERGDKFVMCRLANDEDCYYQFPAVVTSYSNRGFWSDDDDYSIAVPINNQGEPLTAAEAGL